MKELLLYVAKQLVDDSEAVTVTEREDGESTVLELHVAPEDMGKVIGRQGRIAKEIRTIITASASPLTLWTDANSLAASLQRAFCISPLFWPRRPACMPLSCTQTCHGGTAVMKSEPSRARALRRQLTATFYRKNKATFFVTAGAMLLLGGALLAVAWILQQIIDIASGDSVAPLVRMCWLCLGVLVSVTTIYVVQCYTYPAFLRRAMKQYKEYAFTELTKKSISTFSDENTSRYISALTNDAVCIETNYLAKIFTLLTKSVSFVGGLVMMLLYSPLLTGFALLLSLVPLAVSVLCGNRLARMETEVSRQNESFVAMTKDLLSGFSVVKSFKAEAEVVARFCRRNEELEETKGRRRRMEEVITMLGTGAGIVAQLGVFLFGAYLAVTKQGVTPGVVIVFLPLMSFVVDPIGSVPPILANRRAAVALIDKLADAVGKNVRESGEQMDPVLRDGITIDHLSYGYHEDAPVLNDVSVRFEAGKSYAIVGTSGSGKSTLVNLLMGSSNDYQGSIRFDQRELRSIAAESLYGLVSVVQQNVFIFDDTIRNNITMFRHFDENLVQQATEKAGLTPLLAERGEDYICGEGGSGLSGGERQRISIARCLLRQTPVLLIDEATAALDAATAYSVSAAILAIEGLTRIVVTHRLEEPLLRKYDEILVLKNGEICERGSFDALMARREQFYSLFNVANGCP